VRQRADVLGHGEQHDGRQRVHPVVGGRQRDRGEVYELWTDFGLLSVRTDGFESDVIRVVWR